jgi:hypothetical protein
MKRANMKNLFALLAVVVVAAVSACAQNDSVADAARQNQQKKASRVIDDDNVGSAIANTRDVQNATASTAPEPEKEAKDTTSVSEAPARDQKAATPKAEVERQKAKEKNWADTVDLIKEKIENSQTDAQKDIWREKLASAEDGLSKTRKDLANAEQELQESEQNQPAQPAAPAGDAGSAPDQSGTGTSPQ